MANSRAYFWSGKGKSCDRAVYQQACWAEWAAQQRVAGKDVCCYGPVSYTHLRAHETRRHL
eukprot:12415024-Prorocentrum_lima.AAC.1